MFVFWFHLCVVCVFNLPKVFRVTPAFSLPEPNAKNCFIEKRFRILNFLLAPICIEFLFYILNIYRFLFEFEMKRLSLFRWLNNFQWKKFSSFYNSLLLTIVRETTIDYIYTSVCWLNDWMMLSDVKIFLLDILMKNLTKSFPLALFARTEFAPIRLSFSFSASLFGESYLDQFFRLWDSMRKGKAFLFTLVFVYSAYRTPSALRNHLCRLCVVLYCMENMTFVHKMCLNQFAMNELRLSFSFPHSFPFIEVRIRVWIQISFLLCLLWIVN